MSSKKPSPKASYPRLVQYVSLKELAELLGVDRTTVRRTMREMGVPAVKFGGCIRYRSDEANEALEQCLEDATE